MKIPSDIAKSFLRSTMAHKDERPFPGQEMAMFLAATAAARSGHYDDAETLVRQALRVDSTFRPASLDLLAKVYAQQGRYLDAESCWREAMALAPGNLGYMDGLRAIAAERRKSPFVKIAKFFGFGLLVVSAMIIGLAVYGALTELIASP